MKNNSLITRIAVILSILGTIMLPAVASAQYYSPYSYDNNYYWYNNYNNNYNYYSNYAFHYVYFNGTLFCKYMYFINMKQVLSIKKC